MKRAFGILGTAVVVLLATVGVLLSIAYTVIVTDQGRAFLLPRLVQTVDDAIEGSITVRGLRLLPGGWLEISGARVTDPDGDVVLAVERLRLHLDVRGLRSRSIGVRGEIDAPAVALQRETDGSLSIVRAFRPTHPSPKRDTGPSPWTIRVTRLAVRDGSIRYVDAANRTQLAAEAIRIDGRAAFGPAGARLDASLRADMKAPEQAPVSLDVLGSLRGDKLRVRTLRASVGDTALDAGADLDVKSWRGRAVLLALTIGAQQAHDLAPSVPLANDIVGTFYAESNGAQASAAVDLHPRDGGGNADGAAAVRLPPDALDVGADLELHGLDASRVLRGLPSTSVDLEARGRGRGRDLATLRGALSVSLARSRLRTGRVGPAELRATADRGLVEVQRLDAAAPGLSVRGSGRWRSGADVAAKLAFEASDLAAARKNVEALLDRKLPEASGSIKIDANLSGTERAPTASLGIVSPAIRAGTLDVQGIAFTGATSGPLRSPKVELEGAVARLVAGGNEVRKIRLKGQFDGTAGELELTGEVPALGHEPVALRGAGLLSGDRRQLQLRTLLVGIPGEPFELQEPATVTLDPVAVDRLVLASGAQRIVVTGGQRGAATRRTLDARLQLERFDLAKLPQAILPPSLGVAGLVSADLTATGSTAAPVVKGRVELAAGAVAGLDGLSAEGQLGYEAGPRRARLKLAARRAGGGDLDLDADLPVQLARAPSSAPVKLDFVARGWLVPELLRAAKVELPEPVEGVAGIELHAGGRIGAPTLRMGATLDQGRYGDFAELALSAQAEDPGAQLEVTGHADVARARALDVEISLPLRLADALRDPRAVAKRLRSAPLKLVASVPGFELARVSGRGGIPEDLRGEIQAHAEIGGTLVAPRGTITVDASGASYAGYEGVVAQISAAAREAVTTIEAKVAIQGVEVVRASGQVAMPVERLGDRQGREHAAIEARVEIPETDLRRAARGAPVPVTGTVSGHAALAGTLGAPHVDVQLTGTRIEIASHPLGDLRLEGRARDGKAHAGLQLAVTTGGTLDASLDLDGDLSLDSFRTGAIRTAPARARVAADHLDLGFLPAAAPGIVRSASGKLGADLVASGPLTRMVPRGTVALVGGKLAVAEIGDWTDLTLTAVLSDDSFRVTELSARRHGGKVHFTASVEGIAGKAPATLVAELQTEALTIPRAGQDLATIDVDAKLTGKVSASALEAELRIPSGTVRLPNRIPRRIQPLDQRPDIVVGKPRKRSALAAAKKPSGEPYRVRVQVLVPGRLFIKSDNPRMNVELRADVTADYQDRLALEGDVETVRGQVEPISGRIFDVKRGRVRFTGEPMAGMLEVQAQYNNPAAKVYVAVAGTIEKPDVKLTSEPAMEESQIALLIATGRAELKAGSGGVSSLASEETGKAALGAVATTVFRDVLSDKLPVDTVALDSSQLRAGKYVTDKIYVGYTRRFNANPEQGENTNEVRVEYQITPRWTFQSRYGDAQSGGASVLWSKDY